MKVRDIWGLVEADQRVLIFFQDQGEVEFLGEAKDCNIDCNTLFESEIRKIHGWEYRGQEALVLELAKKEERV